MSLDDEIDRLGRVPILSAMNYEALRLLAFAAESCHFKAGDLLFSEGDEADGGFLITSGTVSLAGSGTAGRDDTDRMVGPGTLIGEQALLSTLRRPVTARAEERVTAIKISRQLLARVLQEYPGNAIAIRRSWARKLGTRLKRSSGGSSSPPGGRPKGGGRP